MIQEINLSPSNVCNANCMFCPRHEYIAKEKFMSVELVEKIAKEITSAKFKKNHKAVVSHCSENGEMFLNPKILDILRVMKRTGLFLDGFSNLSCMTQEHIETICDEGLLQAIHTNIDGASDASYREMKGLDLQRVESNLRALVEYRGNRQTPRIFVHVIPMESYVKAVRGYYGRDPLKYKGHGFVEAEQNQVIFRIGNIIKPWDSIGHDQMIMWAERSGPKRDGDYSCPLLGRIKAGCAFINPAGDWYACCFDMGNELILGNVKKESLHDIYYGEKRARLIRLLEEKKFDEIGSPCSRVDACQIV